MRTRKALSGAHKIDLADPNQVRLVRKHLGVSKNDLVRIVEKAGNLLAAVSKEVEPERAEILARPIIVPQCTLTSNQPQL